jgi:hypothetical protein
MDEAARGGGVGSTTLFIGMTVSGGMTSLSILEIHDIQYRMRTGRGSRKRGGGGALRIGVGKKSNSLFIHRQLIPISVWGLGKESDPPTSIFRLIASTRHLRT